ncbi:acyl transferase [Aquimarina sp. ERC-38]|uniref:LuxE/PaaK family acyltransferase n=1 Tax=Aquimarina sp. ERC-38 TaxID=2949996 RepID=UPI0022455640|nr:acyl transferase [Aquimarina sp. ERC-38]UZO81591.1 acyl transferase [Aquimarina sp. ERC-38]
MQPGTIFTSTTAKNFENQALTIFQYQYTNNTVYQRYCNLLGKSKYNTKKLVDIPFLPISFFKSEQVISGINNPKITFSSSGTTGTTTSKHYVADPRFYLQSFTKGFEKNYGAMEDYIFLALLPSYLEREGSSLIYMVDHFIKQSRHKESGYFLYNLDKLASTLDQVAQQNKQVILIGVTFALLDFATQFPTRLSDNIIVMETGGMKGKRKEITRHEVHKFLKKQLGITKVHSEYGMTELLSQAYSKGNGIFTCPPWMKVLIRDPKDPLAFLPPGKTGGINVIDLANVHSCSFIGTQDLGKMNIDGNFEVLGRFDHSDIRGCNLMSL